MEAQVITRHADEVKAYKDVEFWFKQGFSVCILHPGEGDKFYTVHINLLERRDDA